jgi:hypothetical protein
VPGPIAEAVMKNLAKDPARRDADGLAFRAALLRAVAESGIELRYPIRLSPDKAWGAAALAESNKPPSAAPPNLDAAAKTAVLEGRHAAPVQAAIASATASLGPPQTMPLALQLGNGGPRFAAH